MNLSIIILSYKNPALLRLCLTSLSRSLPTHLDYEVIVVDNETSLETRSVLDEFSEKIRNTKLVPLVDNTGYTRGVNQGIKASTGEYILYANYDVVFELGAIETLYNYIKNHPDTGLVGPKLLNFNGTEQSSCFRFYSPWTIICRRMPYIPTAHKVLRYFLMQDVNLSKIQPVDWVSGAIFITSKSAVEKVGLMDEHLYHYFSDVDWARRFWDNGYQVVYFPEAKFFHYHGQASRGRLGVLEFLKNRATIWHIEDGFKYFLKHGFKSPTYIHS